MAKQYTGVRARGNSIQVDLPINGQRTRFSIPIPLLHRVSSMPRMLERPRYLILRKEYLGQQSTSLIQDQPS
jgi:hypothetical protein